MKVCVAFLAALGVFCSSVALAQEGGSLPDVTVKDVNGRSINVSDLGRNGKPTIINFWATWCSPCKKQLRAIAKDWDDWVDETGVELYAVSTDDARNVAKVKNYIRGQRWDYEVLLDTNQDLKRVLNFQTIPLTLLVDTEGKIVWSQGDPLDRRELYRELRALRKN